MPYHKTNRHINIILFIGIMLVAANLRAPITSVGVALPSIKDTLHTTNSALSFMTVVPLIAFGIVSFFASKIGNAFGLERTIFVAFTIYIYWNYYKIYRWPKLVICWNNFHWCGYRIW